MVSVADELLQHARDEPRRLAQIQSQSPRQPSLREIPDRAEQQLPFLAREQMHFSRAEPSRIGAAVILANGGSGGEQERKIENWFVVGIIFESRRLQREPMTRTTSLQLE